MEEYTIIFAKDGCGELGYIYVSGLESVKKELEDILEAEFDGPDRDYDDIVCVLKGKHTPLPFIIKKSVVLLNINKLIGMTEPEAEGYLISKGFTVRIVKRDYNYYIHTADFNTKRVNLEIHNGVVVSANIG